MIKKTIVTVLLLGFIMSPQIADAQREVYCCRNAECTDGCQTLRSLVGCSVFASTPHECVPPAPSTPPTPSTLPCPDFVSTQTIALVNACRNAELSDPTESDYCTRIDIGSGRQVCEFIGSTRSSCQPRAGAAGMLCERARSNNLCSGECPGASIYQAPNVLSEPEIIAEQVVLPNLQIPIPKLQPFTRASLKTITEDDKIFLDVNFIGPYLVALYKYLVGISGIVAGIIIIWAGVKWLTSAGSPDKIGEAKKKIAGAAVGLILVLGSYVILQILNPELVIFKPLRVEYVKQILLTEVEHGGGELRAGTGATDPFRLQSCDDFAENGQEFQAYFTHYYKPSPYGNAGDYTAAWILSDENNPSSGQERDTMANSAFFCAVAMECSCPSDLKDITKRCYAGDEGSTYSKTGRRHGWAPCAAFDEQTAYCNNPAGLSPGNTVAADRDCFYVKAGCELLVDNRKTVKIIDSGSGIRGKRFDLFVSGPGDNGGIEGGSHTVKITNPNVCRPCQPGEYEGKCTTGKYRGGIP